MEKTEEPQLKEKKQADNMAASKSLIWDCGSSLYDSFELKSFERQLNSAISCSSSRTLSMPHLSDPRLPFPSSSSQPPPMSKKTSSKIYRSFQKLLKFFFSQKKSNSPHFPEHDEPTAGFYIFCDKGTGELTKIPDQLERDGLHLSAEINPLVRRTASERFTPPASVGISCA